MKKVFRDFFKDGGKAVGTWTDGDSGGCTIEYKGLAGYDFMIVDDELGCHSNPNPLELIRTIENTGMAPIFRVRKYTSAESIQKYLDMGASGIVVPNIRCKEHVDAVIQSAKYFPMGHRGFCTVVRANDYGTKYPAKEFIKRDTEDVAIILLIEEKEAVENIEEICKVEGVTGFLIGRMDLALSLGIPAAYGAGSLQEDPTLINAMDTIIDAAHRHGIYVGLDVWSEEDMKRWAPKLDFVSFGGDQNIMNIRSSKELVSRFRNFF